MCASSMPVRLYLIACALAAAAGCVVGELGEPGSGAEIEPGPGPGASDIPTNGLDLTAAPLEALSAEPLPAWIEDAAAAGGEELLAYVATCALAEGESIVAGGLEHFGYYGLAPEWADSECGEDCRGWVSACLLAHANALDTPVQIAAVGAHPGLLEARPDGFTVQEAAFYGDVFAAEPSLFACAGSSVLAGGDQESYLAGRICGLGSCGLLNTGICALPATDNVGAACEIDAGDSGGFDRCRKADPTEPVATRVITVYL